MLNSNSQGWIYTCKHVKNKVVKVILVGISGD
jgi:hypothetical protein